MTNRNRVVQTLAGAAIIIAGGAFWTFGGAEAAGTALIAAGGTLIPTPVLARAERA